MSINKFFIVFDNFDGARFSVDGCEVFKVSNSSIVRTYSNVKKIDAHNLNGVICGKAIYEGKIKIDQAIKILNKNAEN